MSHVVTTAAQLDALFGVVGAPAREKELDFIHPHYRKLIEASPFAMLATSGAGGLDASPRGDAPGFVVVEDEKTLLLPERKGNNRVDSLRNIIDDDRVALLFLIPGVNETMRVNGRASISTDPALLERFAMAGALPKCVVRIAVESAFFQCGRAILRSQLWSREAPQGLPTPGTMLAEFSKGAIDGAQYDSDLPQRQRSTLY
jgi:PPOX class probable FMN-dependent enzyme